MRLFFFLTNMRPNVVPIDSGLYECTRCGARVTSPETRLCDGCGAELRNLAVSRDL